MCPKFELAINNIHALEQFDIYITGSNAFLLSSDLATLFTGRTIEIKVFPFSFREFIQYYDLDNDYTAFDRYLKEGGMAGSYLYQDQEIKYDYISDVFDTLIVRDIKQKYKIRRYDIKGKKYLSFSDKFYLSDHTFRYAKLGTKNMDRGRMIENIVAVELLRRRHEVYVGVLYKKEIDFIALKRNEKIYIQVSDDISEQRTFEQGVNPLSQIKDAYRKLNLKTTNQYTVNHFYDAQSHSLFYDTRGADIFLDWRV